MLRTLFIAVFLSIYILVAGIPLLLYTVISRNPNPLYWAGVRGVRFFVRAVGVKFRVKGLERIPPGTCLFVANHTSSADAPAVVGAIPRRIAILLKRSLFSVPIVGAAFRLARFIPVERARHEEAIAALEKATEALKAGQSFLIYPEGTRSPGGDRLHPFSRGFAHMALQADVPVRPVLIDCDPPAFTKRMRWYHVPSRPFRMRIVALEPLALERFAAPATPHAAAARVVAKAVQAHITEHLFAYGFFKTRN